MIQLYRNNNPSIQLRHIEESPFMYLHSLMSEHKIVVSSYRTPSILDVQIGDWLEYKGVRYTINTIPGYSKVEHTTDHSYDITFEHPIYKLFDKSFRFEGQSEFPFFGTLDDFANHLISQINEIDPGWTKGEIAETPEQHINFDGVSCRVALTEGAEAYGAEFFFDGDGKRLNMVVKVGIDRDITLQYGKGKGLYNLTRTYVQEKNIVTRAFGTGGTRNLPVSYPYSRLQLPYPLEANIDRYGIKEGEYRNDEIIPTRTGTVSSVTPFSADTRFNKLTDINLDFDIKAHLAPGLTAKIGFQDGELAGEEFEITDYDHATRTITYLTNSDTSTGVVMPNETFQAKAGDKYKLFDILLPQSYVDAALEELQTETQAYLDQNKFPQAAYDLNIDVLHFKREGYELNPGDRIRVIDSDIHLDELIRVTSVSYPLAFPEHLWPGMQYNAEIASNFIPYTIQERIIIEQKEAKKAIKDQSKLSRHTQAALEEIARAAAIQQFERTYVGELAILTGALLVGNPSLGAVAGVSGLEDLLTAIRFFAGSDFEDRDTAPFRVDQAGNMWATNAYIEGVINALSGTIGNWEITEGGLVNNDGSAYIIARDTLPGGKEATAIIGANVLGASVGLRAVGLFRNTETNPLITNYGIIVDVQNGERNIGIHSNAPIVNKGFNGSYNVYEFTPTSGNNVINPSTGNVVICTITNENLKTVYFPDEAYITRMAGISPESDFCIKMTIISKFSSVADLTLRANVNTGWTIKTRDFATVITLDEFVLQRGEATQVAIIKQGGTKWIQKLTEII